MVINLPVSDDLSLHNLHKNTECATNQRRINQYYNKYVTKDDKDNITNYCTLGEKER